MTLKEARDERRLTQEALAAKSGVTQSTISAIERGDVSSPTWDTVYRLCRALRVRPQDVFPVDSDKAVAS